MDFNHKREKEITMIVGIFLCHDGQIVIKINKKAYSLLKVLKVKSVKSIESSKKESDNVDND